MWGFPIIKAQELDLHDIGLIACSDTSRADTQNLDKGVHFFTDDYRFENLYRDPERTLDKYRRYRFVLTPDYSLYSEMDLWRQIESIGKARWVGAYWQNHGMTVIPTISWAQPFSYSFCFEAIEKNAIVAVSTVGCKQNRTAFMKGYRTMVDVIDPKAIICYGKPFQEMEGNIVEVKYRFSRKVVRNGR